jgi:pimeloyl-ACP methyl ester carboxylesterase
MRPLPHRFLVLTLLALVSCPAGCGALRSHRGRSLAIGAASDGSPLAEVDRELAQAEKFDRSGNAHAVDAYFRACRAAWDVCAAGMGTDRYSEALTGLLSSAQRYGRLDPARGLVIYEGEASFTVPILHQGSSWKPSDFQRLHPPPQGREPLLLRRYVCPGIGVPLVVERVRHPCDPLEARFLPEMSWFGATAILRFSGSESHSSPSGAVLEFHNPHNTKAIELEAGPVPLAADLSAALAQTLEEAPRTYLAGFVDPGGPTDLARLSFLEPYQPGKIPVVLIHGLFSDPLSWADLINDLRTQPGFTERFQIWLFRYPTGQGFLQSAAALRREMRAAIEHVDPVRRDPALQRVVLVGHSMGGLVAKLQVTHSDELIWSQVANRPLEEIVTSEAVRSYLAETCYFDPSPNVTRVIFIATPHKGSLPSSSFVGRGASLWVEPAPEQAAMHAQLMRDNPGTFNPLLETRFPTSIDMLTPKSPLLAVMRQMRLRPGLAIHTILGVSHPVSWAGPSDGIVSVASAEHPGSQSVLAVGAPHAKVHRSLETSFEILKILEFHGQRGRPPSISIVQ